jgi:hypothetical protein
MNLVGVAIVRNEADIVEAFVRHNLHYLDRLVVIDHQSDDDTPSLLAGLRAEGLALTLRSMHDVAFDHAKAMGAALRMAAALHPADACFALDADEFLRCESRAALHAALAALPDDAPGYLRWQTMVPGPEPIDGPAHVLRRLTHRLADEPGAQHKVVLRQALIRREDWRIETGNHWLCGSGGQRIPGMELPAVRLAHLPFRSPGQLVRKAVLGWLGHRVALGPRARELPLNWHWRGLYERLLAGWSPGWQDLAELAASAYGSELPRDPRGSSASVLDPLPVHAELRWPALAEIDPLLAILRWTDRLVEAGYRERSTPRGT